MRFMIMHKNDRKTEAGEKPPMEIVQEMGAFIGECAKLKPSAEGKRLTFRNNDVTVIDGPFAESKELLGGFAVMELSGMEAVALCRRYAKCLGGTVELDLRLVDQDD